jgi:SNF2 family DNA or RNA helicase
MERDHGINLHKSISYCELRSVKFKQPKHGLLVRKDYTHKVQDEWGQTTREIEKVDFYCSKEYLELVNEGILLVIDEIQNIKNMSNQLDACKELMRPIIQGFHAKKELDDLQIKIADIQEKLDNFKDKSCQRYNEKRKKLDILLERREQLSKNKGKSRILLLSGSPIDKKAQVIHFYRALGIMTHEKLSVYNPQTWQMMWRGMAEVEDYCKQNWGVDKVMDIKQSFAYGEPRDRELEDYCYKLFQGIVKPNISSSMNPLNINTQIHKRNAFYNLDVEHEVDLLERGVALLSRTTRFNQVAGTVDFGSNGIDSLRGVVRALTMIETAKISLFVRVAQTALEENPNQKVVICVNYTETINDLMELLGAYQPLRLDGSLSAKQRGRVIEKFQAGDNLYRLLIGNLSVCSTGIDLDDQYGDFPRICLVSPNYSTITLYQLSHRFQRANTKSDATIHFMFCKEATELPILNALAKKSNVMKEVTDKQVEYGIVFPGDYETWEEEKICLVE